MKYNNIVKLIDNCVREVSKQINRHKPEVLAGTGVCLFLTSAVHAVIVTPKACDDIQKKKSELGIDKLTTIDTVKTAGKYYIFPIVEAALGTTCTVISVRSSCKKYTALYSAYGLLQESYDIYKDKVIETIGENKEKKINAKVDEELVKRNYDPNADYGPNITANGTNLTFFMDRVTGRLFYFDANKLPQIASNINGMLSTSITGEIGYMESVERYLGNAMKGDPGVGRMLSIYQGDLPTAFANVGFQFIYDGPECEFHYLDDGRVARILDYRLANLDTRDRLWNVWKISTDYSY